MKLIFTVRRSSAVFAVVVCMSVHCMLVLYQNG